MEESENKLSNNVREHLSGRIDAPDKELRQIRNRTPKSAGNKSFRRHNRIRFMITERRRELGKIK
jgi:hypothetical protein